MVLEQHCDEVGGTTLTWRYQIYRYLLFGEIPAQTFSLFWQVLHPLHFLFMFFFLFCCQVLFELLQPIFYTLPNRRLCLPSKLQQLLCFFLRQVKRDLQENLGETAGENFSVSIGKCISSSSPLMCGMPQGSILSPLFFPSFPFGSIVSYFYGVSSHHDTADAQIYSSFKPDNVHFLSSLSQTQTKQEYKYLAPTTKQANYKCFGSTTNINSTARNLGIRFESRLNFEPRRYS